MKTIKILSLATIALLLMACSFTFNLPSVSTGSTHTMEISESVDLDSEIAQLRIEMGAGSLNLSAGSNKLVEGEIIYNVDSWEPEVSRADGVVTISQKNISSVGIPDGTIKNIWDLRIGSMPLELSLTTGAYEGDLDLSGLALTQLTIADGASKSIVRFDSSNPAEMRLLSYKTGASDVELIGLANASPRELTFEGGVGSYTLDFTGQAKNEMDVSIRSGMSDLKLVFPEDVQVRLEIVGGLSNIDLSGTWTVNGNTYESGTTGHLIDITVEMAVGNLQIIRE